MDENRLKEIIELAHTPLPVTGYIPNARELLKKATKALAELTIAFWPPDRSIRQLKEELRFICDEAVDSEFAMDESLSTDPNSDRGDHDLK